MLAVQGLRLQKWPLQHPQEISADICVCVCVCLQSLGVSVSSQSKARHPLEVTHTFRCQVGLGLTQGWQEGHTQTHFSCTILVRSSTRCNGLNMEVVIFATSPSPFYKLVNIRQYKWSKIWLTYDCFKCPQKSVFNMFHYISEGRENKHVCLMIAWCNNMEMRCLNVLSQNLATVP